MSFGHEDFCQRGKKKRSFLSTPKKKYNSHSEQGDMKMLTLNDFVESLKDVFPESIMFSAVPKPDIDFATDLVKQQTDNVPENLCSVYDWISKSVNTEEGFANLFADMSREKSIKSCITDKRTKQ